MHISDLQVKDVVSIKDGRKLGRITDIEINNQFSIVHFIVEPRKFFRIFSSREEVKIKFEQIKRIGEDVILVEI